MRILATNDDGIHADGLWCLVEALSEVGEVVVVAPDRDQSGVGTSVTLHQPVRVREIRPPVRGVKCYAIEGTPADSVILALGRLVEDKVDMVFSGINEGPNLGSDVLISGTVSAGLLGYLMGIPATALSVAALERVHFDTAARLAVVIARMIEAQALPQQMLLNINLPNLPLEQIQGVEVTRLGHRTYQDVLKERQYGKRRHFWIVRSKLEWESMESWEPEEGTDMWAVFKNRISITPLHSDLTSPLALSALKQLSNAIFQDLGNPPR